MRAANAGWGVYIERRGVVTWPSERLRVARETLKAVCCRIGVCGKLWSFVESSEPSQFGTLCKPGNKTVRHDIHQRAT